eukprot:6195140-Pleurochrysis_carterae.AAC.1
MKIVQWDISAHSLHIGQVWTIRLHDGIWVRRNACCAPDTAIGSPTTLSSTGQTTFAVLLLFVPS